VYRSAAAYGRNNERALPEIAAIIESRYEIRAVKTAENTERERERERSYETQGLVSFKGGREGASFMHANYANCVIASLGCNRDEWPRRERKRAIIVLSVRRSVFGGVSYVSLAEPDGRNDARSPDWSSEKIDQGGRRTLTDTETAA